MLEPLTEYKNDDLRNNHDLMKNSLLLTYGQGTCHARRWPWQITDQLETLNFALACALTWEYGEFPHFKALHFDDTDVNLMETAKTWGVKFVIPVGVEEHIRVSRFLLDNSLGVKDLFFDPVTNPEGPFKTLVCKDPETYEILDHKWRCDQLFNDCRRFHYDRHQALFDCVRDQNQLNVSSVPHNMVLPVTIQITLRDMQIICEMPENDGYICPEINVKFSKIKSSFDRSEKVFVKIPMGTSAGEGVQRADSLENLVEVIKLMKGQVESLNSLREDDVALIVQQGLPLPNTESEIYTPSLILSQALYHEGILVSVYFMVHPDPSLLVMSPELKRRVFLQGLYNMTLGHCCCGNYNFEAPDSIGLVTGPLPRHLNGEERTTAEMCPESLRTQNLINILEHVGKRSNYTGIMDIEIIECLLKSKKKVNADTEYALLEINPRFSGGIFCTRPMNKAEKQATSILDDYFKLLQSDNAGNFVKQLEQEGKLPMIRSMGDEDLPMKSDLVDSHSSPFLKTLLRYYNAVRDESIIENSRKE